MNELQTRRVAALVLVASVFAAIAVLVIGKIVWSLLLLTCGLLVWIVVVYAGKNPRRLQHTAVVLFAWSIMAAFLVFAHYAIRIDMWGGARLRFGGLVAGIVILAAGSLGFLIFHTLQKQADKIKELTELVKGSNDPEDANY